MNLSSLTSSDLKHIATLLERKEQLLEEISHIEESLNSYQGGQSDQSEPTEHVSTVRRAGRPAKSSTFVAAAPSTRISGKRAKRGELKETILGILKDAGKEGISIQDIASKAGVKPLNVSAWLAATGKKLGLIEKAGRGVYRLKG